MSTATITDPLTAWALASRDEADKAWNALYDAKFPPPRPADCSAHHNAFGAGCPWCSPRRNAPQDRAAGLTARCATTTQKAATS